MKDITVGYFDLLEETFLSAIEINKNFLNLLKRYVNVKIIPIAKREEIKDSFRNIEKYELDYLYIDSSILLKNIFPSDYFQKPSFYNLRQIITYVISMRCVKILVDFLL